VRDSIGTSQVVSTPCPPPLAKAIKAGEGNCAQVSGLPNLHLSTWILVVPGAILALLAGRVLISARA
jgi:hypothetical protein